MYLKTVKYHFIGLIQNTFRGVLIRIHLYKYYFNHQLKHRKGKCIECGNCCWKIQPTRRCENKMLDGKCSIYFTDKRPRNCKDQPINNLDIFLMNCKGYTFK